MSRTFRRITGLMMGLLLFCTSISHGADVPAIQTIYEKTTEQQMAKGLVYEQKEKLTEEGWLDIHVLKMDMTEESLELDIVRDMETFALGNQLSDMTDQLAEQTDQAQAFVGAVNGSFFGLGTMLGAVVGVEVEDKQMTYAIDDFNYYEDKAANLIVDSENGAFFDFIDISLTLETSGGHSIRLQGINSHAVGEDPMIFNRNAYEDMSYVDTLDELYKIVIEDDTVTKVAREEQGIVIPENGYVMVFPVEDGSRYLGYLQIGSKVTLKQTSKFDPATMDLAIAGGGFIIKNGILADDGIIVGRDSRHPRTAIGLTEDGQTLIAMVVDGRGRSIGATHREMADWLFEYDVFDAIHMDGGGSSTMVGREPGYFESSTLNTPSDGHERPVVNGLGFLSTALKTTDYNLFLKSDQDRVFVNNKVDLTLLAYDLNFNPVEVNSGQVAWSMTGGYGTMDQMTFTPKSAGSVTLTAHYQGKTATISIEVAGELIDLEVVPKVLHHDEGAKQLTVVGTDAKGYRSIIDNELLEWTIGEPVGTIENGLFTPADEGRTARITVRYGEAKEYAYVISGMKEALVTEFDSETVETLVYPDTVMGSAAVAADEFGGYLRLEYDFAPSESSQAVYGVFDDITVDAPVDQLLVHLNNYPESVMLKGHIQDSNGEQYTVHFEDNHTNIARADMPSGLAYPVHLSRLYTVTLASEESKEGAVRIDRILTATKNEAEDVTDVLSIPPVDALYDNYPEDGFELKIFGATSGRNRLLDEVVMSKVYEVFNAADYAVYAGSSNVDESRITNDHFIYNDKFDTVDLPEARIISLGMGEGSMVKTDMKQWDKLALALSTTVQKTIVIIGTEQLINNTDRSFTREGELIHETLSDFATKSGKYIFYVNASGYSYDLSFYEGIRYVDLNGLWYRVDEDHSVDLYDSFQTVNLTFSGEDVTYNVQDLYPKTTVGE